MPASRPSARAARASGSWRRASWPRGTDASSMWAPRKKPPALPPPSASTARAAGSRRASIDCHTHLVHGGDRATEFEMRLAGATYEEIARAGGGIALDRRARPARPSEDALVRQRPAPARPAHRRGRHHDRDQVRLRARPRRPSCGCCAPRAASASVRPVTRRAPPSSAPTPCRPSARPTATAYIDLVCADMLPAVAEAGLADAVDAFCEGIALLARRDRARLRGGARPRPSREAACRPALQPARRSARGRVRRALGRPPRIHGRGGRRRDGRRPARSRCCCPAPSTPCARRKLPPVAAFRDARHPDGARHRLPIPAPRRSPRCCSP